MKKLIIYLMSPLFVFIFLNGFQYNAYAISDVSHYKAHWAQDTIEPEKLAAPDTILMNQPDIYSGEEYINSTVGSKKEMKALRKEKADKFWVKVLLGLIAILLKCESCDCDDW